MMRCLSGEGDRASIAFVCRNTLRESAPQLRLGGGGPVLITVATGLASMRWSGVGYTARSVLHLITATKL